MRESPRVGRRFFWQGLLILLPVVVLSSAGFFSLRQDRILARHEAIDKARGLADQIADVLWERLFHRAALTEYKDHSFGFDAQRTLIMPPPAPALPAPARLDPSLLDEAQRPLWDAITTDSSPNPPARAETIEALREFLALMPPPSFAAQARFRLAQELRSEGDMDGAAQQFERAARDYPDAISESGLPWRPLASFKALEVRADGAGTNPDRLSTNALALQTLCSNLVRRPSFLTPHLLGRAGEMQSALGLTNVVGPWLEEWARHDALRELAQAAFTQAPGPPATNTVQAALAPPAPPVPALFWFHAPDHSPAPQAGFPLSGRIIPRRGWKGDRGARNTLAAVAGLSFPGSTLPTPAPSAPMPDSFRFVDRHWLASRLDDPDGGHWLVCRALGLLWPNPTNSVIGSPALDELKRSLPSLPPWLDYSLDVAGVTLTSSNYLHRVVLGGTGRGSGPTWVKTNSGIGIPEILASAGRFERGIEYLRVNLHFVSPELFYARQHTRTVLFGGLIGIASLAALVGFVSARRAFLRQQQLSDLKSNFVSSVSHELRAPIASMRLLAESLQGGKVSDPARQSEYFRFLVQECRRLSALIENVLNFARIEQGRKQYELDPTDVPSLLRQTVKLMEPAATEKQLQLTLELPEGDLARLAPPLLDGQAIQQALINLIDNALKHSPPGQTVTVGMECAASAGPHAVDSAKGGLNLFVQDHGAGIPPEEHERIFERFYRRGSELRRETQGIGIGLSIVQHIAEAHGGRVRVDSQPGQGSRFTLELPLPPADETPGATSDKPAPSPQ